MTPSTSSPRVHLLRELRRRTGLTQAALSEDSGVSVRTIRHIERGEVDAPHPSSLLAIADALHLGEDGTDALLRACIADHVPTTADVLGSGPHIEDRLRRAQIRAAIDVRLLSGSYHVTVGADRRIVDLTTSLAVQAVRDGVDSMLVIHRGDASNDVELSEVRDLHRCVLLNRLDLPEHQLTLCELGFGRRLAAGEVHLLRHGFGRTPSPSPQISGLAESDGFTQGPRRRAYQHIVEVTFIGPPPEHVWEIEQQPDGTVTRLHDVEPDTFGAVHTVGRDRLPGPTYGFEWAWPT